MPDSKHLRRVTRVFKSIPTLEGAGVHLRRAFGFHESPNLDPFLLLDDFHSNRKDDYIRGFPWHPHRGIETITYMLEGRIEHGDSLGNKGVIHPGDVQWMTAGSGIIHQEMPKGTQEPAGGPMWGFQLWANLPRAQKMMDPRYRDVRVGDIPIATLDSGATVRVVCGEVDGVCGPVQDIVIDPEYLDVSLPEEAEFIHEIHEGYTAFAYTVSGSGIFDERCDPYAFEMKGVGYMDFDRDCDIKKESLIVFGDGKRVKVTTGDEGARFILISGKPLNEPVAWYGPIVMNTQDELRIAFQEYRDGTFIKHR